MNEKETDGRGPAAQGRAGIASQLSRSASSPSGCSSLTLTHDDELLDNLRRCESGDWALHLIGDAADEIERLKGQLGVVQDSHKWLYAERQRLQRKVEHLRSALSEAALQLQYMHDKFSETGSGNAVLARIKSCLRVSDERRNGEDAQQPSAEGTPARPSEGGSRP